MGELVVRPGGHWMTGLSASLVFLVLPHLWPSGGRKTLSWKVLYVLQSQAPFFLLRPDLQRSLQLGMTPWPFILLPEGGVICRAWQTPTQMFKCKQWRVGTDGEAYINNRCLFHTDVHLLQGRRAARAEKGGYITWIEKPWVSCEDYLQRYRSIYVLISSYYWVYLHLPEN